MSIKQLEELNENEIICLIISNIISTDTDLNLIELF